MSDILVVTMRISAEELKKVVAIREDHKDEREAQAEFIQTALADSGISSALVMRITNDGRWPIPPPTE